MNVNAKFTQSVSDFSSVLRSHLALLELRFNGVHTHITQTLSDIPHHHHHHHPSDLRRMHKDWNATHTFTRMNDMKRLWQTMSITFGCIEFSREWGVETNKMFSATLSPLRWRIIEKFTKLLYLFCVLVCWMRMFMLFIRVFDNEIFYFQASWSSLISFSTRGATAWRKYCAVNIIHPNKIDTFFNVNLIKWRIFWFKTNTETEKTCYLKQPAPINCTQNYLNVCSNAWDSIVSNHFETECSFLLKNFSIV